MARRKADTHRLTNGLTAQQFTFVLAYAKGRTVAEAAKFAGYSTQNHGYTTLAKPHVKQVLEKLKAGQVESGEGDMIRRDVIEELKAIAFSDVRDMLQTAQITDANGEHIETFLPANPKDWTQQTAAAVARIKFHPADKGGNVSEIALWPKMDALKQLALLTSDEADDALPHTAASVRRFSSAIDVTPSPADTQSAGSDTDASDTAGDSETHDT